MPYTHPHSRTPKRNAFLGRNRSTETPRYKKTPVGEIGGYQVEQCLGDCHTDENKRAYPFLGREVNGKLELYWDPALPVSGGTKRRRRKHRNNSHKRRRSGSKFKSSRSH